MHSATTSVDRPLRDGQRVRMAALTMPADKDYLALARLTAMHVAGLLGMPVGRVGDLRLAVDEACLLLLGGGERELELNFDRYPGALHVIVRGPEPARWPDPEDVGWLMLQALVDAVRIETVRGTTTLTLVTSLPAR
jgi:serine/threonine-protein kinase RsbW